MTGYNRMAEANDLIMLYPQAQLSQPVPYNSKGGRDFLGYSSPGSEPPDYFTRNAPNCVPSAG